MVQFILSFWGVAMNSIDTAAIQTIVDQMRHAVSKAGVNTPKLPDSGVSQSSGASFGEALKTQLNEISRSQQQATDLGQRFSLGDESVNLSDVMIAGQKANIQLQTAIQVRNKLVSAYHDIMNMQI